MKQFILIVIVVALATLGAYWLISNKPEIIKHDKKPTVPVVKVTTLTKQNYAITVHSSGVVEAHTQTNLVAEVAGKITQIGDSFQEGSYLKKNDLILRIDETDYLNNINIAKAEIAQSKLNLEEQIAQRDLAKQDWDLFGEKKRKPTELAMRKPHIASAKAALAAAKVRMEQAQVQLERTKITAPYNGRVLQRNVDIGQYVTPGTVLGKVFAIDSIEVRLPLSLADYEFLDIPEHYQGESKPDLSSLPKVNFYSQNASNNKYQWQGKIVRTSASLDTNTRQLSVIARIENPFSRSLDGTLPVRLGQYLQADIKGRTLTDVIVVPASAIREQKDILLFDNGKINIQPVQILFTEKENVIVDARNLPQDSEVIITPPPLATNGMKVKKFKAKGDH